MGVFRGTEQPSRAGVVRMMAGADHWHRVCPPRWMCTAWNAVSTCHRRRCQATIGDGRHWGAIRRAAWDIIPGMHAFTEVVTLNAPTRPTEEIARLGKGIYERDIRPKVEADHVGKYVAIDIETGDWAIANCEREALERLRAQCPGTIDVLLERVGYRALRSFGAGSLRKVG